MANISKEEIIEKIEESIPDENIDAKIELMEDISDSIEPEKDDSSLIAEKDAEIERLKAEIEELKRKYKERFLSGNDEEPKEEDVEELKEEEYIDIDEI